MASQPHFFKFILADSLLHQKLSIPRNFVKKYGENLSNQVLLKLPNGAEWKVELTKSNYMFWLDSGWHKFAEDCFLDEGHLLVFRYDKDSCFYVLIFDTSGLEIEYPCKDAHRDETDIIGDLQVDESPEILDDVPLLLKRMEKTPPPSPRPYKKMRNEYSCRVMSEFEEEDFASTEGRGGTSIPHSYPKDSSSAEDRGGTTSPHSYPKGEAAIGRQTIYAGIKARALQRANAFKSENPFFTVLIQPTVISEKAILFLPRKFAGKYFDKKCGNAYLTVSDRGTWVVGYTFNGASIAKFVCGWKKFSKDNKLKVGDVCVFEMIKDGGFSFKVLIFPVNKDEDPFHLLSQGSVKNKANGVHSEKNETVKLEPNIISNAEVGFCNVRDHSPPEEGYGGASSVGQNPMVQDRFQSLTTMERARVDDFSSELELMISVKNKANGVQSEKNETVKLEPNIITNAEVGLCNVRDHSPTEEGYGGASLVGQNPTVQDRFQSLTAIERARVDDFSSEHPFFKLIIRPSHIDGHNLHVPTGFAKSYLNVSYMNGLDAVLQTSDDRTWFVKFNVRTRNMNPTVEICYGWTKFVMENKLKVGDICLFELIKPIEMSFNVEIFRGVSDSADCSHHQCRDHQTGSSNEVQPKGNSKHENGLDIKKVSERPSSSRPFEGSRAARKLSSSNSFKIVVLPYKLEHSIMNVPNKFAMENLVEGLEIVKLQVGERLWPVKLLRYGRTFKLSGGLSAFAKDNSLQVGDICRFVPINKKDNVLKVTILRCLD